MPITYDQVNNRIRITGYTEGSPCGFNELYIADIGATNGRQLLDGVIDADPDTFSLDEQPKPADSKAVPLKISCTARAGATCNISGTDAWGNPLTENNIDISSGSATTSERFKTVDVNGVTVNGLQVGDDFDIHQDRWGIVWKLGDFQFKIKCRILLGDGVTETWFLDVDKQVVFEDCVIGHDQIVFQTAGKSHLTLGSVVDVDKKTTAHGCAFIDIENTYGHHLFQGTNLLNSQFYSCFFIHTGTVGARFIRYFKETKIWNCVFAGNGNITTLSDSDVYNLQIKRIAGMELHGIDGCLNCTFDKIVVTDIEHTAASAIWFRGNETSTVRNVVVKRMAGYDFCLWDQGSGSFAHAVNVDVDREWHVRWLGSDNVSYLYREYEVKFKCVDKDGAPLSGVNVKLYDKNNNLVYDESSGSDGKTAVQDVSYAYYHHATGDTPQYYGSGADHVHKRVVTYGSLTVTDYIKIDHKIEDDQITLEPPSTSYDDLMNAIKKHDGKMTALKFV